jgi:hypothetical protein
MRSGWLGKSKLGCKFLRSWALTTCSVGIQSATHSGDAPPARVGGVCEEERNMFAERSAVPPAGVRTFALRNFGQEDGTMNATEECVGVAVF